VRGENEIHLLAEDQIARHFRRTVRIRLTVLGDQLDIVRRAADVDAVRHRLTELRHDIYIRLGEESERTGHRRDIADLQFLVRGACNHRREWRHGRSRTHRGGTTQYAAARRSLLLGRILRHKLLPSLYD